MLLSPHVSRHMLLSTLNLGRQSVTTPVQEGISVAKGRGGAQKVCDHGRRRLKADAPAVEGRGHVAVAMVPHLPPSSVE
jgi:hypothetical protein